LRLACVLLWTVGVALTAIGIFGDRWSWWTDRPFATNLISTAAGASLGIPVAVLILDALASKQSELAERRAGWRLLLRSANDLREAAAGLVRVTVSEGLTTEDGGEFRRLESRPASDESAERLLHSLSSAVAKVMDVGNDPRQLHHAANTLAALVVDSHLHEGTVSSAIYHYCATWDFAASHVRARAIELDVGFIPNLLASEFHRTASLLRDIDLGWIETLRGVDTILATVRDLNAADADMAAQARATFYACQYFMALVDRSLTLSEMALGELQPSTLRD
jgi:hypothetical protein